MRLGILRSGLVYGLSNALSAGVPFLLLPILTRALSPAEYGHVVSFFIWVSICMSFAGLNLHAAVPIRWTKAGLDNPQQCTATAIVLIALSTIATAAISAGIAPFTGLDIGPWPAAAAALIAGCTVLQGVRFGIWQMKEQPVAAASLQVASSVLNLTLSLIGVFVLMLESTGRILGATTAMLMIAILSAMLLVRDGEAIFPPSRAEVRRLMRFGVPLIPHALAAAVLASADRFAVGARLGADALGVYGAALQLGSILTVLADAMVKAYSPYVIGLFRNGTEEARLRAVAITYLSVPFWLIVATICWMLASALAPLLLGSKFQAATDISIWFFLGAAVNAVYLMIAGIFFFANRTEWISIASATAAGLALLMAPIAVGSLGITGGGISYVAAQVGLLLVAWALSLRTYALPWHRPVAAIRTMLGRAGRREA